MREDLDHLPRRTSASGVAPIAGLSGGTSSKHRSKPTSSIHFPVLLFSLSGNANAQRISRLSLLKEILFERADKAEIEPHAAIRTRDGGFIVVGSANIAKGSAWAAKFDNNGIVQWEYSTPRIDELPGIRWRTPAFSGAVELSDGRIVLCGSLVRTPQHYSPAIISVLTSSGVLMRERYLLPQANGERGVSGIATCVGHNNTIIAVGVHSYWTVRNGSGRSYWLTVLDDNGVVLLDRHFEPKVKTSIDHKSIGLVVSEAGITFSATDNINTDVISVTLGGSVVSQIALDARYLMVRGERARDVIQLFGGDHSCGTEIVVLASTLDEAGRRSGRAARDFSCNTVLRAGDGYLMVGSRKVLDHDRSSILWTNADLTDRDVFSPPHGEKPYAPERVKNAPFVDGYSQRVAAHFGRAQFLLVRPLKVNPDRSEPYHGKGPTFRAGLAIDIVEHN